MIENPFDAPIPGQSLTNTPGNYPWEHAPEYTDVEQASEYVWDKMHERNLLEQIITFLENDIPVEAIARMILFSGFTEGKWNPDVAILLSEIVFKQIMAIGVKAEIPNIKVFMGDQSNSKFRKSFAKFKVEKEDAIKSSTIENKAEKFAEEVKAELKAKEPSGLMKKETE
tara:strand:+ start:1230 stop:1739 length:510 start_codon:yes stop_codon:yes gene_type:complete